jgi:hypothetical protein
MRNFQSMDGGAAVFASSNTHQMAALTWNNLSGFSQSGKRRNAKRRIGKAVELRMLSETGFVLDLTDTQARKIGSVTEPFLEPRKRR